MAEAGLVRHLEQQLGPGKVTVLLASGCAAVCFWAGKQGKPGCQWLAWVAGKKAVQLLQAAVAESVRHLKITCLQTVHVVRRNHGVAKLLKLPDTLSNPIH